MFSASQASPELDPPVISVGAYEAALTDTERDEEKFDQLWVELSRENPDLALSILKSAKHAAEAQQTPDKIFLNSALLVIKALSKETTARTLDKQLHDVESINSPADKPNIIKQPRILFGLTRNKDKKTTQKPFMV